MTEAYPLSWPEGQARTPMHMRRRSLFKVTQERAMRDSVEEVRRLGGRSLIISTNIPIRKDGLPYADADRRIIRDNGVAVYFDYKGEPMCFACDKWETVRENVYAISKTIEALRGIERWGSSDMMERAFRGYTALPSPMKPKRRWREVFGFTPGEILNIGVVKVRWLELVNKHHPDREGGSHDAVAEVNHAYDEAKKELGA